MRVLFVEDNADLRELIGEILADEAVDFVACGSAEEAEALFAETRFDVLLTDVSLPKALGTDLARGLRAGRPDLWVIFLSGYALGALEPWGPRTRALLKPFESEELHGLLNEAAGGIAAATN